MYVTPILEFSRDPLSDTTPTWTDITQYLLSARWASGIQEPGTEPQPGFAEFVLDDRTRRFEPLFAAGAYYPDIVPMRRLRWRITSSAVTYDEGIWYAVKWQPDWPGEAMNQETTVTCADGFAVLAQDDIELLDPPDADTYSDVVEFDDPYAFYHLSDPKGTQMVSQIRRRKRGGKKRRKTRTRVWRQVPTELAGTTGETGVYVDPLGDTLYEQPGLLLGEMDTCVRGGDQLQARAPEERTAFQEQNAFSIEAWVEWTAGGVFISSGPLRTSTARPIFSLDTNGLRFDLSTGLVQVDFTSSPSAFDIVHLVGTWDGGVGCIYYNGVLEASATVSGKLLLPNASEFLYAVGDSTGNSWGGKIAKVAFYEHALPAERVMAHYQAGAERGWPQQTVGERIADIATHALWSEAGVQTTGRDVQPQMKHGQQRTDEIGELAHAEGPKTLFYFNGTGGPEYRGHEWQATAAAYNTVQITVGNAGGAEVPYAAIDLDYDDEVYNDITVSHETGEIANAVDTASVSAVGRRANTDWTDLLLMEHSHVEALASHILSYYKDPAFRPTDVALTGEDTTARLNIFTRKIGHLVRVKHRPKGSTAVDRVTHIIGFEKTLNWETLTCTWHLDRGFQGDDGEGHLGIVGFSELGSNMVLA